MIYLIIAAAVVAGLVVHHLKWSKCPHCGYKLNSYYDAFGIIDQCSNCYYRRYDQ